MPIPLNNDQNQLCFSRRFMENSRVKNRAIIQWNGDKRLIIIQ